MPTFLPSRLPERLAVRPRLADVIALLAGALTTLAFEPFALFPLAVLGPAALFLCWRGATARRAAWRGFLFGAGLFGVGVSWVFVSMHTFGNMTAPLAIIATVLLVAALSLYLAALGAAQAWLTRTGTVQYLLVLPALWTLGEWWRGWFLTGFPWLNLGYSQTDSWLAGYAPVAGVYGVSLMCALSAGLLAQWLSDPGRYRLVLAVGVGLWATGAGLTFVEWATPAGAPMQVVLVQGNVALRDKWRIDLREANIRRYVELSRPHLDADLIVWPEAAVPATLEQARPLLAELGQRGRRAHLVLGVIEVNESARTYYNGVVNLANASLYRKQHLVPFGEYLPMPWLFEGFIRQMHIPMSNFSRGAAEQPPFLAAGQVLGISVCYEDAFGEELIRQLPRASLLVNVSEDAWFGNSLAPHQRVQMARLRALETARPMLRAGNTGPSAVIDHRGRTLAKTSAFRAETLTAPVQPMQGSTPYVRAGNLPVVLLSLLLLAVSRWRRR
ncbi:MAG: apolipoprotein N-acyltransferase [Pseudomonadota bacterium]